MKLFSNPSSRRAFAGSALAAADLPATRGMAQMYFPEETEANAMDLLYKELRADAPTSVAQITSPGIYRWDIVLMAAAKWRSALGR